MNVEQLTPLERPAAAEQSNPEVEQPQRLQPEIWVGASSDYEGARR